MGGKVAIREKAKVRQGEPGSRSGKPVPAPTVRPPAATGKAGAKAGGGRKLPARPARVAPARYPSPERRLAAALRRSYRNMVAYFRETRLEMRKVVWPSRRETAVYTLVVIAATAIVGLVIWVFDIGLSAVLRTVIR